MLPNICSCKEWCLPYIPLSLFSARLKFYLCKQYWFKRWRIRTKVGSQIIIKWNFCLSKRRMWKLNHWYLNKRLKVGKEISVEVKLWQGSSIVTGVEKYTTRVIKNGVRSSPIYNLRWVWSLHNQTLSYNAVNERTNKHWFLNIMLRHLYVKKNKCTGGSDVLDDETLK